MANCCVCGETLVFGMFQMPDQEGNERTVCKSCLNKGKGKGLGYDPVKRRYYIADMAELEVRKQCNVCGHIICYTPADLVNNRLNKMNATASTIASVGGAMGGLYTASAVHQGNASQARKDIIDYSKCPQCGSKNLRVISQDELVGNTSPVHRNQAGSSSISAADELIKFKELFDMGVISQEEFNQKKQECLHGTNNNNAPSNAVVSSNNAPETYSHYETEDSSVNKLLSKLPTLLFWASAIIGVWHGYNDIYNSTFGFIGVYRGELQNLVGNAPYTSSYLAALLWFVISIGGGLIISKISAKIVNKIQNL